MFSKGWRTPMAVKKSTRKRSRRRGVSEGFLSRYSNAIAVGGGLTGIGGLIVALVALVPAFRSVSVSQDGNWFAQNSDLSVVDLDVMSTVELNEDGKFSGEVVETGKVNVSAAKITLHNSGEQAALVKELRVHVSKFWAPEGCHGAGPGTTSVLYDFVVPGDIDPFSLPLTMSKNVDFEVAGQSNDRLAVTIGEEYIGEAGWPWIISASAELVLVDGKPLPTGEFILMNDSGVDRVIDLVNEGIQQGNSRADCVRRNMGVLEEALRAPGEHAPSIRQLLDRLESTGIGAMPDSNADTSDTPSATTEDADVGTWVAQLGSYAEATTSSDDLQAAVAGIEEKLGVDVQTAQSSQYASLRSGYFVVFYQGNFANGHEALSFCSQHGIADENACVGRYFSSDESDMELTCRFSDPPDSVGCVRS